MSADRLGKYELVQHLASGGMANVYLARLSGLGGFERHVVLKTLRAQDLDDDTLVPMFLDEARLVATLHHQHIAQVFEVGSDDGTYFLAMEYVHGETVRGVLETAHKRGRALPIEFGITVVCAAAAGLHHAHERRGLDGMPLGIVHRDVTPSNVIVSYDGSIKLIDFGIAKAIERATVTRTGLIKGKVGYMAPEQVRGYVVDRRSDVFALGVLAYELTTQTRAFDAATQFEQLERAANGVLVRPTQLVPGYPPALEDVVMTALELDPDDRYPSAEAMRLALVQVARELDLSLGEATSMRVLAQLYGARPEPWLVPLGSHHRATTNSIETPPFPMVRHKPARVEHPAELARGSDSFDAVDEDATTNPVELPLSADDLVPVTLEARVSAPASLAPPTYARAPSPMMPPLGLVSRVMPTRSIPALGCRRIVVRATLLALSITIGVAIGFALVTDDVIVTPVVQPVEPVESARDAVAAARDSLPPIATSEPPPPADPRPAADRVTLHVITDPPGATVVLDGVRLGTGPYLAEVPRKQGGAWLKVRKVGHIAVKTRVSLERDVTWTVRLRAKR